MRKPRPGRIRARSGQERGASRSTALLQEILDSIADGVVVADARGRLVLFNPAAERMLGVGLADVPQAEWTDAYGCFRPDRVTPYPAAELPLARALRGETVAEAEVFVRNAGTAGISLSINATPLRDGRGAVRGGVVVFRDVTARAQELSRIELLSNVVEQTADGVLVTDAQGRIEYVNPAFVSITGYSREELLGRTPALLSSGEHGPAFYAELWRALSAGEVYRETITDRRKNGETFLAEQTLTPMHGPAGETAHVVSIVKDVTELRRAQQREHALQVARRVQQRLYPEAAPRVPGLDIHGRAFVADATGGDYFDFVPLAGDRLALVIGDVSGHGLDSALVMAELRAILRSTARTLSDPGGDPHGGERRARRGHRGQPVRDGAGRGRAPADARRPVRQRGPHAGLRARRSRPGAGRAAGARASARAVRGHGVRGAGRHRARARRPPSFCTRTERPKASRRSGRAFGTERLLDVVRSQRGAPARRGSWRRSTARCARSRDRRRSRTTSPSSSAASRPERERAHRAGASPAPAPARGRTSRLAASVSGMSSRNQPSAPAGVPPRAGSASRPATTGPIAAMHQGMPMSSALTPLAWPGSRRLPSEIATTPFMPLEAPTAATITRSSVDALVRVRRIANRVKAAAFASDEHPARAPAVRGVARGDEREAASGHESEVAAALDDPAGGPAREQEVGQQEGEGDVHGAREGLDGEERREPRQDRAQRRRRRSPGPLRAGCGAQAGGDRAGDRERQERDQGRERGREAVEAREQHLRQRVAESSRPPGTGRS